MKKGAFIIMLGFVLKAAGVGLYQCYLNDENDEEVILVFENGYVKKVNIACDSRLAIIQDVVKALE